MNRKIKVIYRIYGRTGIVPRLDVQYAKNAQALLYMDLFTHRYDFSSEEVLDFIKKYLPWRRAEYNI